MKVIQSFKLKLTDADHLKFTPDGKVLILDGGTGPLVARRIARVPRPEGRP